MAEETKKVEEVVDTANEVKDTVKEGAENMKEEAKKVVEEVAEDVTEAAKNIKNKAKEETKNMKEEAKKTVAVEDEKVKLVFRPKTALKYVLTGLVGVVAGAAGKAAYDNRRSRRNSETIILDPIEVNESTPVDADFEESVSEGVEF